MAKTITVEQATATMNAAVAALEEPANAAELATAKAKAAGNLMILLQTLMPKVIKVIGPIIEPLGFSADQAGIMQFVAATTPHMGVPAVAAGKAKIMALVMPQKAPPADSPITVEQARTAMAAVDAALEEPANQATIAAAKTQADGNLMMLLTALMPKVIAIIGPIIEPLGFTADQPGVMKFVAATNPFSGDPDIAAGKAKIMATMAGK